MFKTIREIRSKQGVLHFKRIQLFSFKGHKLCLHKFYVAEKDPYEHDHPSDFICMNIWGGYSEVHNGKLIKIPLFKPRLVKAEYHHRIQELTNGKLSVSLSFAFPKRREWGYVLPSGRWLSNSEYFKLKNTELSSDECIISKRGNDESEIN